MFNNQNFDPTMLSEMPESVPFAVDELLATTANTPIMNPDADYLASTTKIDISG